MFLSIGNTTFHVTVEGPETAPPLLLLHALGATGAVWEEVAARLSRQFRIIRPDLRGHGLSGVTPGPYEIAGLALDMLGVLDALGIRRTHVAGLSLGGMVAQAMAAEAPARVLSLVLCGTALALPPPETWRERAVLVRQQGTAPLVEATLARWVTPDFRASPVAEGLRAMLLRSPPEGYAAAAEAVGAADLTESTRALRLPALVLVGEHDPAPLAAAEALAAAIPGAQLEILAGAAHVTPAQVPGMVALTMQRFLLPPPAEDDYEAGLRVRREVMGETHVGRALGNATSFDADFQRFVTRAAWGGVWARPGLDRRTRSLLTLAMLAALGRHEEFRLHLHASRNAGASSDEVAEALMQVAVYAGVPAANTAFRIAKDVLAEMATDLYPDEQA